MLWQRGGRRGHARIGLVVGLAVIVGVAALVIHGRMGEKPGAETVLALDLDSFLARHWAHPLPPQGMPTAGMEGIRLDANHCGDCHSAQRADWETSRHSASMGAGIEWQFHVYGQAGSNDCMQCHAPLAEQKALVALDQSWKQAPAGLIPEYLAADLHRQGLTCAACHMRGQVIYGPPHRAGLEGTEEGLPHRGFQPHPAFSNSQFCSSCHQFPEDGPRLNGKLRQDTYNEWLQSGYPEQGIGCQQCHMPNRRHLWRGISDPEMLRLGLSVRVAEQSVGEGNRRVRLELKNSGAGHRLPTYMVPRIQVRLLWLDAAGTPLDSILEHDLQWRTSVDLSAEHFDQRLMPGEHRVLEAPFVPPQAAVALGLWVDVAPKDFYERMYRHMLEQRDRMRPDTLALLLQAIDEAEATHYRAIDQRLSLEGPVRLSLGDWD
jgi:hypothetical protein